MIPVNKPLLDGNELLYLRECIESGWISSEGAFVTRFEAAMAELTGRRHAIAVSSGTAALECAVIALDLQPDDEVVMPTFTIISCAAAIIRGGCKPIFVDSDPLTWNMDTEQLAELLDKEIRQKGNRKIKAIMAVHTYGLPAKMDAVMDLAGRYGLKVIEDAAEAHGLSCSGQRCGSFGELSTFSFYANKHVTTGEGGMVLTDDALLADRCRSIRNLYFQPMKRFVHEALGHNFRMSNLQAAVGVAQLERLDQFVDRKRRMGQRYHERLAGLAGLQLPVDRTEYAENGYWVYGVVLGEELASNAQEMMQHLGQRGVGTRSFFWPLHQQPALNRLGICHQTPLPVAERLAQRGFYLPSGLSLTDEEIDAVAKIVIEEIQ